MNYFKIGVSDWEFELDDETKFSLKHLVSECVKYYADEKCEIVLDSATFNIEDWENIFAFKQIKHITQTVDLADEKGNMSHHTFNYYNCGIIWYKINGKTDWTSEVSVKLVNFVE